MNRRNFIYRGFGAAFLGYLPRKSQGETHATLASDKPSIEPMPYGSPRPESNIEAWFGSLRRWGVRSWATMLNDFRNSAEWGEDFRGPVVPLLSSALPRFQKKIDAAEERRKAAHILRQARACEREQIDFWCVLPFPIFPSGDLKVVQQCAPEFFSNGKFNLLSPHLPELLKAEIRALKKQIPNLKGINLWMAEGAGSLNLTPDDLRRANVWQPPLLKAFDEVTTELGMSGILFSHEFLLTVGERRAIYERTAKYPKMIVEEDITWPEEDMLHPFMGYLPAKDRAFLFRSNPVAMNYLLDTEYIGQGVLPSVYPRWWKRNVDSAVRAGAKIALGRTFFWDGGYTDVNFNRLNVYLLAQLCRNPGADEKQLLAESTRDMFGAKITSELIEILWQTEPVIKNIVGINRISPMSHSRFPQGKYLDATYMTSGDGMKVVSDLFEPAGTPLFPPLTDELQNLTQWRWQDHTVSKDPQIYLNSKRTASTWVSATLPRVERLSASLSTVHRELFVHGYRTLDTLAKGMELFVEAADLHYRWAHAKKIRDADARAQFDEIAVRIEQVADSAQDNALNLKKGMLEFASFLRTDLHRTGN